MAFRLGLIALAAVALALVVASCGGGGSSDEGTVAATAEPSTRSEPNANGGEASESSKKQPQTSEGTGKEPATGGSALSESEFVKQANAVCATSRKGMLASLGQYVKESGAQVNSQSGLVEATKAVIAPTMEEQIEGIRALGAPASSAQQVDAFLSSWQQSLKSAEKESIPLAGSHIGEVLGPTGEQARQLGLDECAYG